MFQDILHKIVHHVDGVRGCVLLDPDSVPIAEVYPQGDEATINALGIELTNLVNSLVRRNVLDDVGAVREFSLTTSRVVALCCTVGENYILLVALAPEADAQRGLTMLRLMSPWIERLL